MAVAICLFCGTHKASAVAMCPACGGRPTSPDDVAKSLLLTDRHRSGEQLTHLSQQLQRGEGVEFDVVALARVTSELESQPALLRDLTSAAMPTPPEGQRPLWRTLSVGLAVALVLIVCVRAFG